MFKASTDGFGQLRVWAVLLLLEAGGGCRGVWAFKCGAVDTNDKSAPQCVGQKTRGF